MIISSGNLLQWSFPPECDAAEALMCALDSKSAVIDGPNRVHLDKPCNKKADTDTETIIKLFLPSSLLDSPESTPAIVREVLTHCPSTPSTLVISVSGNGHSCVDAYRLAIETATAICPHVTLGVADLNESNLRSLVESLKSGVLHTYQVHAKYACSLDKSIVEFARVHDIKLVAHHDPPDILPQTNLAILADRLGLGNTVKWDWIVRVQRKCITRQILTYLEVCAELNT